MTEAPTEPMREPALATLEKSLSSDSTRTDNAVNPPVAGDGTAVSRRLQNQALVKVFLQESQEQIESIRVRIARLTGGPAQEMAIYQVVRSLQSIEGGAHLLGLAVVGKFASEIESAILAACEKEVVMACDLKQIVLTHLQRLEAALDRIKEADRATDEQLQFQNLSWRIGTAAQKKSGSSAEAAKTPPLATPDGNISDTRGKSAQKSHPTLNHRPFTVRMDMTKLDYLVNTTGELTAAETIIRDRLRQAQFHDYLVTNALDKLVRTTREIRRSAMSMRMVPASQLFGRSAGLVKELARELGKEIRFETTGAHTQIDKSIAERVSRPLLHIVHHAVCNNIELPAARAATGKSPLGCVRVSAQQKGAEILIEVTDDGIGDTYAELTRTAANEGPLPAGHNRDAIDLVCQDIAELRGMIEVKSEAARGTTFRLRLPVTLTITQGVVVRAGQNRFMVPNFAVQELVKADRVTIFRDNGRSGLALLRNELIPVVRLSSLLDIPTPSANLRNGVLIITEWDGKRFGFWTEELVGTQEVIVRELGEYLRHIKGILGCGILPNGRIELILDLRSLYRARQEADG